jgi:hypothetical protein
MGMAVMGINRDLLVNAWYTGGVDVIDFSRPTKLREIAYYDIAGPAPWARTTGPRTRTRDRGSGGGRRADLRLRWVRTPDNSTGLEVFQPHIRSQARTLDHLNPQTMD